jgi:hypothetical protein
VSRPFVRSPSPHSRLASRILGLALAACTFAASAQDEVIGKIGDIEVKASDLRQTFETLSPEELQTMRNDPAGLNQFVRALLVQRLVAREALEAKWDQNPVVAQRMQSLREGVIASTYLDAVGVPPDAYPSEAELQATYEASKSTLLQPKSWRLAQIYVADPVVAGNRAPSDAASRKLDQIKEALSAPQADFAAIAKQHSEEPSSAALGGEIGWLFENQIHPDVLAVLPGLKPSGPTSQPVRMEDGWHFIRLLEIRDAFTPSLDQIRDLLVRQLRAERGRIETQAFLARLLQEHPVAINEMAVSKLVPPAVK